MYIVIMVSLAVAFIGCCFGYISEHVYPLFRGKYSSSFLWELKHGGKISKDIVLHSYSVVLS